MSHDVSVKPDDLSRWSLALPAPPSGCQRFDVRYSLLRLCAWLCVPPHCLQQVAWLPAKSYSLRRFFSPRSREFRNRHACHG